MIDYTLLIVLLGSATLGIVSGALGCFAVLRRQSLLGDAISHAALPGVALAFLVTLSKNPIVLVIGALIAGWVGTLFVLLITKRTKLKTDAALGIVLSVFFGFGLFLLTIIQRLPTAKKAGLDTFLFGNASTLLKSDVVTMIVLGIITLGVLYLLWKEFKVFTFDSEFSQTLGFSYLFIDVTLTSLIVVSIVIGLQTVGVVLMSAMVIAPAVAARQWTDRLSIMVLLSGFFGFLSGVIGATLSSHISKLPTGPTIVLVVSSIVLLSLLFSPHRGLIYDFMNARRNKRKIRVARTLLTLYRLSESHKDPYHSHDALSLRAVDRTAVLESLRQLSDLGLAQEKHSRWSLTPEGVRDAKILLKSIGEQ